MEQLADWLLQNNRNYLLHVKIPFSFGRDFFVKTIAEQKCNVLPSSKAMLSLPSKGESDLIRLIVFSINCI